MAQPPGYAAILPIPNDGSANVYEDYGYLTGRCGAYDQTEQRWLSKTRASRNFGMVLTLLNPIDARNILPILYSNLDSIFGVPLWQYASKLIADWTGASAVCSCSTLGMPIANGDHAIVWQARNLYDARRVSGFGFSTVTLNASATQTIVAANGLYVPVYPARLKGDPRVRWRNGDTCRIELEFAGEDWVS